ADAGTEPRRQLSLHMHAAVRAARPAGHGRHAADEILDFARALDRAADTPWSHRFPWDAEGRGSEIRLASRVAAAGGLSRREAA
ncbi:MAG: hypothetical protein ACKO6B_16330, partial [Planctomycetia bacterium]